MAQAGRSPRDTLLITLGFPPARGGIQSCLYARARLASERIVVLAPDMPSADAFDEGQSFPIHRWPRIFGQTPAIKRLCQWLFSLIYAAKLCNEYPVRRIECGQALPFGLAAWCLHVARGIPYRVWVYGDDVIKPARWPLVRPVLRKILHDAETILAISEFTREQVRALGIAGERTQVIYPPLAPDGLRWSDPPHYDSALGIDSMPLPDATVDRNAGGGSLLEFSSTPGVGRRTHYGGCTGNAPLATPGDADDAASRRRLGSDSLSTSISEAEPEMREGSGATLLTVARLEARKGIHHVIEMLPALRERFSGLRYIVAGEGPARARLESLARRLGVMEHVQFAGDVDESQLSTLYSMCDVFVMLPTPAQEDGEVEGFGMVYLEAAAHGRPCVAWDTGGVKEAVRHRRTGLVVREGDIEAVQQAILALLDNAELQRKMGNEARAWAKEMTQRSTRAIGALDDGNERA